MIWFVGLKELRFIELHEILQSIKLPLIIDKVDKQYIKLLQGCVRLERIKTNLKHLG